MSKKYLLKLPCKIDFPVILLILLISILGTTESKAQFATYREGNAEIDVDLGSGKIKGKNIEKIQLIDSSGIISQIDKSALGNISFGSFGISAPPVLSQKQSLNLDQNPLQLLIFYKPDVNKPSVKTISIPVTQVGILTTLESLKPEKTVAKGADDAELYVTGEVTTAEGSSPNWSTDFKYEKKYGSIGNLQLPFLYAPFANFHYNSKVKGDTDKFNLGIKFTNSFGFAATKPLEFDDANIDLVEDRQINEILDQDKSLEFRQQPRFTKGRRQREQREYFLYEGTAEFESDWDFRVRNIISSQTISYLLHPKLLKKDKKVLGNFNLTPFAGGEIGWNLRNPSDREDRGIFRLKAGATLTLFTKNPFEFLPFENIVWTNTFTQRWAIAKQFAYEKDTDGKLVEKGFGKAPFSHFKSVFELKATKFVSPTITYEWGNEAPLFNRIRHKVKFGLTYSYKAKELAL